MRHGCALALMVLIPMVCLSGALQAQDEADSAWVGDSTFADSSGLVEVTDDDTLTRRTPDQVSRGESPYLREVKATRARAVWWGSIGVGAGNEAFRTASTTAGYGPSTAGPTLALEAGRTFNRFVGLGLELFGWLGDFQQDYCGTFGALLLVARVHPMGSLGPFLKAGGGLAAYGTYDVGYDEFVSSDVGPGYVLGAGWDIPVSRGLLISSIVELHRALLAYSSYHERVLSVGLMLTWSGRQDDLGPFSSEE